MIMSRNFAKTLVWKHGNDVKWWRHKQRTPNTNDHHTTLNQNTPMKIFCVRHCIWYKRHITNVSITPVIIANLAYMNIKKHGELLELICMM